MKVQETTDSNINQRLRNYKSNTTTTNMNGHQDNALIPSNLPFYSKKGLTKM